MVVDLTLPASVDNSELNTGVQRVVSPYNTNLLKRTRFYVMPKFFLPELLVWLSKYPLCSPLLASLLRVKVRVEISNDLSA